MNSVKNDILSGKAMSGLLYTRLLLLLNLVPLLLFAQDKTSVITNIDFHVTGQSLDENALENASGVALNSVYNPEQHKKIISAIDSYLQQQGYLYGKATRINAVYNEDSSRVKLQININSGPLVRMGSIKISSDSLKTRVYENLLTNFKDRPYSEEIIEENINEMLKLAADSGFVFAQAKVEKIDLQNVDNDVLANLQIHIKEGERVIIDEIEILGNSYTNDKVILRELPVKSGSPYSKIIVDEIPQRLLRLNIFKDVKSPAISLTPQNKFVLSVEVEEGNATTFDGVIGYIPENTSSGGASGFFTGLVDISFRNLFGTARSFDVHWEKPDRESENFFLRYTEPWLLDYPIDVSVGLERTVRDSTYIEWKGNLRNRWRYNHNFSIVSAIERQVVLPDSAANRDLRLVRYAQTNLEIGVEYDTRDYPVNPRKGIFFSNSYTFGYKENFGPGFLLREDSIAVNEAIEILKVGFKWYYELFRNQVLALQLTAHQVRGDRLQITDYIWFGGARTLRGYRENQFRGDKTAWMNFEYRFLLSRNSRIFVFNDWGGYRFKSNGQTTQEILPGYGIGIRLNTGLGILAVDFGLGKGDSFSQGKIHFGILNRF